MEHTRQQKIARLIQKDLSDIFLHYARQRGGLLISVSEVRVSPDLSLAHVYLSMAQIARDGRKIRGELGSLERHQLRIIPELYFHLDETLDKMDHIDQLLHA